MRPSGLRRRRSLIHPGKGVSMKFTRLPVILVTLSSATAYAQGWPQWGQSPQHSGSVPVLGQSPNLKLASQVYDPLVVQEQAENGGELLAHYQAPLINDQDVFMEF